MKPFDYHIASSLESALSLRNESASYIAGGTNEVDLMKKHIHQPDALVDVNGVLSAEIRPDNNGIEIGAVVKNSILAEDREIAEKYPLISEAILAGASPQIRNMATTAGNLMQRTRCPYFYDTALPCNKRSPGSGCGAAKGDNSHAAIIGASSECVAVHPSDLCVALVALDAEVRITEKDGSEKSIPFTDFHRLPGARPQLDTNLPEGSLITSVYVPGNEFYEHYAYLKIRERSEYAFALVSVAAALVLDENNIIKNARLASGGVAHKPWRWEEAEAFLTDRKASRSNFEEAAEICVDQTEPMEHNAYKVTLLRGAIETALVHCMDFKKG
ncbi:MAG: xanthine dehydrogenase family protein subunit M [Saprospiraceae bacterium]|nr:xanthine dehydrogenase family protein subunit M [Saprospiraceae bacterium]